MSNPEDRFDAAMSRRLAQLGAMPVDTSRLEKAVRAQIGAPVASPNFAWRKQIYRSLAALAASLIFVALIGMAFFQNRPAQASSDLMLQLHRDIVAGKIPAKSEDSFEDVNKDFSAFSKNGPQVMSPDAQVMGCCMPNVGNKQVFCVLLKEANTPVTLTIADLDAVKPSTAATVMYKGEAFHVQRSAELTMVTVDRGHHRLCLIGQLPAEKLMSLTDNLKTDVPQTPNP